MVALAEYAHDERTARMLLSALAEADNPTLGRVLYRVGALETLELLDSDSPMPGGIRAEETDMLRFRVGSAADERDLDALMRDLTDGRYTALIPGDAHWPKSLDDLGYRAPYVLWARGATSFLATPAHERITFSGARAATSYGEAVTNELVSSAVYREQIIVAGGAYGIDAAAHRTALREGGHTIAIMAGGLDRFYPSGNKELLSRVADSGVVISEQPPATVPTRDSFGARNRLLAALSASTVIVEAGTRSGSMSLAREAAVLDRAVGAVPGQVTSAASYGTHMLLREGTARIITNGADLEELIEPHRPGRERGQAMGVELGREEPENAVDIPSRSL